MPHSNRPASFPNHRLPQGTAAALVATAVAVGICYGWVDRPVAYWVHDQHFARFELLKWLTYPPPMVQDAAPWLLIAIAIAWLLGPLRRWHWGLLAAAVAIILADQFRESFALVFARDWPETWVDNNPSLIRDGAYGFHPFQNVGNRGSFPSGHAARTAALAAVVWIVWPRLRLLAMLSVVAVAVGLVGMNYHFVGDVIAGTSLGALVGVYTAAFCGLLRKTSKATSSAASNGQSDTR